MHSNNGREPASVLATIRAALPTLSRSQQGLARLALEDPVSIARLTITDYAERSGTSPASVTRLCRALGLDSYAELRMELALAGQQIEQQGTQQLSGDLAPDAALPDVVDALADMDARSIHETARLLDLDGLGDLIDSVSSAGHVYAMGNGSAHAAAVYLELKLRSLGVATTTFDDLASAVIGISLAKPGDVVVVVTPTGIAREAVPMLTEANRRGCVTVAITGNSRSPAAEIAQHCLITVQAESRLRTGALSSMIAALFLSDCISSGLVIRHHDRSVAALAAVDEAMQSYYW